MISDTTVAELHGFARNAGIPWRGFGFDHYDVPEHVVDHVVALGATMIDGREIVRKLRQAGLRTAHGKSAKQWVTVDEQTRDEALQRHGSTIAEAHQLLDASPATVEVLARSSELLISVEGRRQPTDQEMVILDDGFSGHAVRSPWGDAWAVELVLARAGDPGGR